MKHWATQFIGQRWAPERNCWWLVRQACAVGYGINMPHIEVGDTHNAAAIKDATRGWGRVDQPAADGDIVLMRSVTKLHCGIVVASLSGVGVLHSSEGIGVRFEKFEDATRGMRWVELWRRL